jgi:hypothetical protein
MEFKVMATVLADGGAGSSPVASHSPGRNVDNPDVNKIARTSPSAKIIRTIQGTFIRPAMLHAPKAIKGFRKISRSRIRLYVHSFVRISSLLLVCDENKNDREQSLSCGETPSLGPAATLMYVAKEVKVKSRIRNKNSSFFLSFFGFLYRAPAPQASFHPQLEE